LVIEAVNGFTEKVMSRVANAPDARFGIPQSPVAPLKNPVLALEAT